MAKQGETQKEDQQILFACSLKRGACGRAFHAAPLCDAHALLLPSGRCARARQTHRNASAPLRRRSHVGQSSTTSSWGW
jgi:hypothetical protein